MARRLADGVAKKARLGWPIAANEVFPILPDRTIARLREAGAVFHPWSSDEAVVGAEEQMVRLVCSWATSEAEVERFLALI